METRRKKRFIAGAVCPACGKMDTMMLYMEHGVEKAISRPRSRFCPVRDRRLSGLPTFSA